MEIEDVVTAAVKFLPLHDGEHTLEHAKMKMLCSMSMRRIEKGLLTQNSGFPTERG
jgi:hypothetical protein